MVKGTQKDTKYEDLVEKIDKKIYQLKGLETFSLEAKKNFLIYLMTTFRNF